MERHTYGFKKHLSLRPGTNGAAVVQGRVRRSVGNLKEAAIISCINLQRCQDIKEGSPHGRFDLQCSGRHKMTATGTPNREPEEREEYYINIRTLVGIFPFHSYDFLGHPYIIPISPHITSSYSICIYIYIPVGDNSSRMLVRLLIRFFGSRQTWRTFVGVSQN